jgi:hypothetical protein
LIAARADASVSLPVRVRKTIWSESPACAGKRLCNRSTARCESVLGSEKLFAFRLPTACETPRIADREDDPATTTIRRCAIVQRVSFSIGSSNPARESSRFANLHDVQRIEDSARSANIHQVQEVRVY